MCVRVCAHVYNTCRAQKRTSGPLKLYTWATQSWVLKTEFQSSPRAVLTSNCWTKQMLLTLVCDKQILLQNCDSSSPWRPRCPREEQSPLSQEPPADWQEPGKGNFLSQDASWWQMPLNFRQCQAVSFTRMWGGSIRPQEELLSKEELPTETPGNSVLAFHQS